MLIIGTIRYLQAVRLAAVAVSRPLFRTAEKGILRAQTHKTGLKIQELAILSCALGFVFSMQNSTQEKIR